MEHRSVLAVALLATSCTSLLPDEFGLNTTKHGGREDIYSTGVEFVWDLEPERVVIVRDETRPSAVQPVLEAHPWDPRPLWEPPEPVEGLVIAQDEDGGWRISAPTATLTALLTALAGLLGWRAMKKPKPEGE